MVNTEVNGTRKNIVNDKKISLMHDKRRSDSAALLENVIYDKGTESTR